MKIWHDTPTVAMANSVMKNTICDVLGIEFTTIEDNALFGTMPVDKRTHQPMGILHGGASVVLAETLGSVASLFTLDRSKVYSVGLDINANHIRAVREGIVTGVAKPIHLGRSTQVWEIKITDEAGKMVNISRLTMAVLPKI